MGDSVTDSAQVQVDYIHKIYERNILHMSNYMQTYLKLVIQPVPLYIIYLVW